MLWTNSEKVHGLIEELTYVDGHLSGEVSFPVAVGLENGAKINLRAFPISDYLQFVEEALEVATIEEMNAFILTEIEAETLAPEVHRGQIFVSSKTQQPYNVT